MEVLLTILVPGLAGGLLLALLLAVVRPRASRIIVSRSLAAPSPALINMAQIRIEGVGGLGMVAAVLTVALTDPRLRVALLIAAVLGVGLALFLIALRQRDGALPSGGDGPDDRLLLGLRGADPHQTRATARPPALRAVSSAALSGCGLVLVLASPALADALLPGPAAKVRVDAMRQGSGFRTASDTVRLEVLDWPASRRGGR